MGQVINVLNHLQLIISFPWVGEGEMFVVEPEKVHEGHMKSRV